MCQFALQLESSTAVIMGSIYLLNTHRVGLTWNRPLVPLQSRTAGRTDRDCVLLVYLCHNEMLLLVTGMLLYNV